MMRRLLVSLCAAGFLLPLAACDKFGPSLGNTTTIGTASNNVEPEKSNVDIGSPLFTAAEFPVSTPMNESEVRPDPVVMPLSQLSVTKRLDVQSQTDGFIYFIGSQLKAGDPEPNPLDVWTHPRTAVKYRRLKEGDLVNPGQVLVLLDDRQAHAEFKSLQAAEVAAIKDEDAGKSMLVYANGLLDIQKQLGKAGTKVDLFNAEATVVRYTAELASKSSLIIKASGELEKASVRFQMHNISSLIGGRVDKILKRPGEAIKATDTILQIQNIDRLRVEGYLPLEHASKVQVGMQAWVEPTLVRAPTVSHMAHRLPITAVAVSPNAQEPLILSGSEDGMVLVANTTKIKHVLTHPMGVGTVSCATGENRYALTGCTDGSIRLWDLSSLGDKPKPLRLFDERHTSGVVASAFTPDGNYCATADERSIILWDVKTGKKVYAFPSNGHRAPVTSLNFTPQCTLVSASKDNTLCIWEVGTKDARIERRIEHRSGVVPQLGVAHNGGNLLFDQDNSTLHLIDPRDGRTRSVIQNVVEQAKFTTFAKFSPDDRTILTASAADGILQLWRLPSDKEADRVSELRRFICPNGSMPTCAEFVTSPQGSFIVVGTQSGYIHIWPLPSQSEMANRWAAKVTFVDNAVGTDGRQLRVWAEFDNNGDMPLRPGTTATLVMQPEGRVASK